MEARVLCVLERFPYPVAYPYSLVFDPAQPPSQRRWALCFTEYQLLRTVGLPLVGQYLTGEIDPAARDSITKLNTAIAAIRSPFFNDWITLVHTLRRHLPKVGVRAGWDGKRQAVGRRWPDAGRRGTLWPGVGRG